MTAKEIDKGLVEVGHKPVLVIAGHWECSDSGRWDFMMEKKCMSQCVMIHERMSYETLKSHVEAEFDGVIEGVIGRMSYWPPTEMSIFSTAKTPPISITGDRGLQTFFHIQTVTKALNLLVTFVASGESNFVAAAEKTLCNLTGTIRLADGTPSLNSVEEVGSTYNTEDSEPPTMLRIERESSGIDLHNIYTADTVAQLEVVEAMARAGMVGNNNKGKEKVTEEANVLVEPNIREQVDLFLEGSTDEDYENEFWEALIRREYMKTMEDNRLEIGESSQQVHPVGQPVTHVEFVPLGGAVTDVVEEQQPTVEGSFDVVGEDAEADVDSELEQAIQLSLTNIYSEIAEADCVPSHDCLPCFGKDVIETQEVQNGLYDESNDAIYIGRVFKNKADMQTALAIYAIKRYFNYIQVRSDKNRLIVRCVDRNCPWRVFGHTIGWNTESMEVRTATLTHTCDVSTRAEYGKKATCKVIAEVLKSKFSNGKLGPRAVDIPDLILDELRVSITYMKAWHAKEKALIAARGTAAGSYKLLLSYLHMLKQTNPGTVCNVRSRRVSKDNSRFRYLFFAFGACIHAMSFMRRVVIIDGTAIKAKFRGCLMTASFQDGNFQIMPVGFGVVDGENEPAWTWFFKQLVTIIPDASDLVFVSDRHSSIYAALRTIYPLAMHGACVVHLYRNVKSRFSRNRGLAYLVSQAATAYTVADFREKFGEIERRSPPCAQYLRGIGISHWSRVYFQGRRYNLMSSNVAESLNAAIAKALEFPIVSLVETIRMMLMRWFNCRRVKASKHRSQVTPEVEDMLLKRLAESANLTVAPATETIFQVSTSTGNSFTVDLQRKTCSCKVFETLGIPCAHALAAVRASGASITEQVEEVYKSEGWRSAYSAVVMPVPDNGEAELPKEVINPDMNHPQTNQPPGRPRKRRIPSIGENLGTKKRKVGPNRCSRCLNTGHNRATCKSALP